MDRRHALSLMLIAFAVPASSWASGKAEKKKSGGESYLQIDALAASTPMASGRRGVITVDCGLDIPEAGLRNRASSALPRLRSAYVQTIQIYAAGLQPGMPPNADYIARSLQRQTDLVLGRPGARLLIGSILVN